MNETGDFRRLMCCQDCWSFFMDESVKARCRISLEETNRIEEIPPNRTRLDLFVHEYSLMEKWPCEYRYTEIEVDSMRSGKLKEIHVTKEDASRVLKKITSDMHPGDKWRY